MLDPERMVPTSLGPIAAKHLRRVEAVTDTEQTTTKAVEYYLGPVLVHRSAHVKMKIGLGLDGLIGV